MHKTTILKVTKLTVPIINPFYLHNLLEGKLTTNFPTLPQGMGADWDETVLAAWEGTFWIQPPRHAACLGLAGAGLSCQTSQVSRKGRTESPVRHKIPNSFSFTLTGNIPFMWHPSATAPVP
jgi:hypothetical protein